MADGDLSEPDMLAGDAEKKFKQLQEYVLDRLEKILSLCERSNAPGIGDASEGLQDVMAQLSAIVTTAPLSRIGFFGRRGAGKTTLINRIVGCDLLPTGGSRPITASITEISGWQEPHYTAMVTFITKSEWEETVHAAQHEWDENKRKASSEGVNEDSPDVDSLFQQMKAVWKEHFDTQFPVKPDAYRFQDIDPFALLPRNCLELLEKQYLILSFPNWESLKSAVDAYTKREERFWPLVSYISVYGPFQRLIDGSFSLVDIPGEGDEHEHVLNRRFEEGRSMCDRLFYLPDKDQLISAHTAKMCVSVENHLSSQFALIVPHLQAHLESLEEENWNCTNVEKNIKQGLNNNLHDPVEQSILSRVDVFCIENKKNIRENSPFKEKFDHMMQVAFARKSQDDIKACQSRFIDQANSIFAFFTLLLHLESEKVDALRTAMQNVMNNCHTVDCSEPVHKWFRSFPRDLVEHDVQTNVFVSFQHCHFRQLQNALLGKNDIFMHKILHSLILREFGGDINNLNLLQDRLTQDLLKVRNTVYKSFADCLKEHDVEPQRFLEAHSWKPVFDQFHKFCLEKVVNEIQDNYSELWKSFHARGTHCRDRMLSRLNLWAAQNSSRIRDIICKAVITSCQQQIERLTKEFVSQCRSLWEKLTRLPQLHETITKVQKLDLLKPIDYKDIDTELTLSDAASNFVTGDDSPPHEGRTTSLEAAQQRLDEVIAANSAILCSVSSFHMQLRRLIGTVYVLKNDAFKDNIYKIGKTDVSLVSRMKSLQTTGVPLPFERSEDWDTHQSRTFERLMHNIFARVRVYRRREFFNAPLPLIKEVGDRVKDLVDLL